MRAWWGARISVPRWPGVGSAPILVLALMAALFGTVPTASASPVMVVTCSASTGLNIASDIERDRPKGVNRGLCWYEL